MGKSGVACVTGWGRVRCAMKHRLAECAHGSHYVLTQEGLAPSPISSFKKLIIYLFMLRVFVAARGPSLGATGGCSGCSASAFHRSGFSRAEPGL